MSIDEQARAICDDIDRQCAPGQMTKEEALDFYEQIVSHCESYSEALREEMEGEEED